MTLTPPTSLATTGPVRLSAVVCSCNEAHYLPACLGALGFCDELVVVDLESTDDTAAVAHAAGARVVRHRRVPVVERVRRFAVEQARHDWVVFMDPDMVFPAHRSVELRRAIAGEPNAGQVLVYGRNLFLGRPIRYGRWGGQYTHPIALHRRRVNLTEIVHAGINLRDGYSTVTLPPGETEADLIAHRWVDSIRYMITKHRRYAAREGGPRYARGERFTWSGAARTVALEVKKALIWRRGWRDGLMGVGLALFWGWYTWRCLWALRRVQRDPPAHEQPDRRKAA